MTFTITYHPEEQYIEGTVIGNTNRPALRKYATDMKSVVKQHQCKRILSDFREARLAFSIVDLFHLPTRHDDFLVTIGQNIHQLKRAILVDASHVEQGKFFEDVAVNRGQNVKIFTDRSFALEWLLE